MQCLPRGSEPQLGSQCWNSQSCAIPDPRTQMAMGPWVKTYHSWCGWRSIDHWPFQEPKLVVPTIYKAYVREYPPKYGLRMPYMVQYLHLRILKFPLNWGSPKYQAFDSFPNDKLGGPRFALHSAQWEDQSSPNFGSTKCPKFPGGELKKDETAAWSSHDVHDCFFSFKFWSLAYYTCVWVWDCEPTKRSWFNVNHDTYKSYY